MNVQCIESLKEKNNRIRKRFGVLQINNENEKYTCIYNLHIKTINGERVWVDRVLGQRERFPTIGYGPAS